MQQDEKRYIFCTHYSAYGVVTESDWNDVMVEGVAPSIKVHFKNGQNGETAKRLPDDYSQAIPRVYIQETTKQQYDNA